MTVTAGGSAMDVDADPFADLFGAGAAPLDQLFPVQVDLFLDQLLGSFGI